MNIKSIVWLNQSALNLIGFWCGFFTYLLGVVTLNEVNVVICGLTMLIGLWCMANFGKQEHDRRKGKN